jgi:hypothetical protein
LATTVAILLGGIAGSLAVDLQLTDQSPLLMPAVGSYGLRVLSPTLLELTLINSKEPDPARVTRWDFVSDDFQLSAPPLSEFNVSVGGQPASVQTVGFKRRPLYAPLKTRDLRIASTLYLQLAAPIPDGQAVEVTNPSGLLWPPSTQFTSVTDPLRFSPAIHVNEVGYMPTYPKKAMVGYYLGSLGEMTIDTQAGFQLVDASGTTVYSGPLTLRQDQGFTYTPAPYQQVWVADFSAFTTPGRYRLVVPGFGASFPFLIDEGVAATFARAFALGIFHQRCGFKEDFPFTRHVHDACHISPAQVPDMTFTAVNNELANMTSDYASYQTAPQLKDVSSSLYPFVDTSEPPRTGPTGVFLLQPCYRKDLRILSVAHSVEQFEHITAPGVGSSALATAAPD